MKLVRLTWVDYSLEKVRQLKRQGYTILLDINLWDISNTMKNTFEALKMVGVDYFTAMYKGDIVLVDLGGENIFREGK
jgi:orotidine-5'-phosphate decarboxylase